MEGSTGDTRRVDHAQDVIEKKIIFINPESSHNRGGHHHAQQFWGSASSAEHRTPYMYQIHDSLVQVNLSFTTATAGKGIQERDQERNDRKEPSKNIKQTEEKGRGGAPESKMTAKNGSIRESHLQIQRGHKSKQNHRE